MIGTALTVLQIASAVKNLFDKKETNNQQNQLASTLPSLLSNIQGGNANASSILNLLS